MSIYINDGHENSFWESAKIAKIFGKKNTLLCMSKVEAAIARAEAEMGLISHRDAEKISSMALPENIDVKKYDEQMLITGGHPVVSFLEAWKPAFKDDPARNVIHYAASTPDVYDNTTLLRLREAYNIICEETIQVHDILRDMAAKYRNTPMIGRSHNQHAVPITFGAKIANWLMETHRQIERLERSAKQIFVANMYGAAGGLNTLGQKGLEFNALLAKQLGMASAPVSMQTSRDTMFDFASVIVNIIGTMGKIATELFELSRTEIAEVAEPWTYGNIGSSTMPQKRNPWGIETMIAISRSAVGHLPNIYRSMAQYHERDFMSYHQCDYSMCQLCQMCDKILRYGIKTLSKLDVFPERMLSNLGMTRGAVMLERLMMILTKKNMDRFEAHHRLYDCATQSYKTNVPVKSFIEKDKKIMSVITAEELDDAFDFSSYLGCCTLQVDAALDLTKNRFFNGLIKNV